MFTFFGELNLFKSALTAVVLCLPAIVLSQNKPPNCGPLSPDFSQIKTQVVINSDTGIAAALSGDQIQTWDTNTGVLLNSQYLPFTNFEGPFLMGFSSPDEVFIYDSNDVTSDPSGPEISKGFTFNTKTFSLHLIWSELCGHNPCPTPYFLYSPMTGSFSKYILRTSGVDPDLDDTFDLLAGQKKQFEAAYTGLSEHIGGGFAPGMPYLYGMTDNAWFATPPNYSVYRWDTSADKLTEPQTVISFNLADLTTNPKANVETDSEPVSVGTNGNIIVAMNVNDGLTPTNRVFQWYNLNDSSKKLCSLPSFDHYRFQIFDESAKVGILFDDLAGSNVAPKFLNFNDCSLTTVPHLESFTHNFEDQQSYTEIFLVQNVRGKMLFFNSKQIVDSTNGKVLVQFCQ